MRDVVAARAAAIDTDSQQPCEGFSSQYNSASSNTKVSNPTDSATDALSLIDSQVGAGCGPSGDPCSWLINPILRLADIEAIAEVCRANGVRLAVDSTFASPIVTRPIELGADFVIHSLTKYVGGHGDALGGALLGPRDVLTDLNEEALVHYGGVISPFNAWLILRGIATLPLRMHAHSQNAQQVAEFLDDHAAVKRVNYPGLESHPQHDMALRQMSAFSGMLSFQVADGLALAQRMIDGLRVIHYAVSLGHHRSLVYWIGTDAIMESSYKLEGGQLEAFREFAGEGVMRLSVGLEDADDLCRDLDSVLSS